MTDPIIEQRLSVFDHRRGRMMGLFSVVATLGLTALLISGTVSDVLSGEQHSINIDFFVFWGAAKLSLAGVPLDAFDPDRIREAAGLAGSDWMPWAYPPGFLAILTPLGMLPFHMAWLVFTVVSAAAILAAVHPLTHGRRHLLVAAALAPAFVPAFLMGQTSTLWAATLVAALVALQSGRLILAGVFVGLLTLKPQLGLLLPFALIAAGAWRTVISAGLTTLVISAVPTVFFGTAYWGLTAEMMAAHGEMVRGSIEDLHLMVSPYSFMAGLGIPEPTALILQWCITATCIVAVTIVWRAKDLSFDTKAAVLVTAIPLSSPYIWIYESALLAPAALFMLRAGSLR
ncbi:MAG: glycosyltransferase family 87 protein, partial [Pseudomonadota bacterium]